MLDLVMKVHDTVAENLILNNTCKTCVGDALLKTHQEYIQLSLKQDIDSFPRNI